VNLIDSNDSSFFVCAGQFSGIDVLVIETFVLQNHLFTALEIPSSSFFGEEFDNLHFSSIDVHVVTPNGHPDAIRLSFILSNNNYTQN